LGEDTKRALDGSCQVLWYETRPEAVPPRDPMSRRILAVLTLTPERLTVETMSRRRRRTCQRRLEGLLGERIELVGMETKPIEEVVRESPVRSELEPMDVPPEVIAELEDRMIRQWLDESIPALGGLTPREAMETPEGRQQLEALFEYIAGRQAEQEMPPGVFSPDYRKAKRMLGLE
jgi:hypothetical protein